MDADLSQRRVHPPLPEAGILLQFADRGDRAEIDLTDAGPGVALVGEPEHPFVDPARERRVNGLATRLQVRSDRLGIPAVRV